ncbi:MltA domain-containing protein [Brevundimonas variabilis]|uniref:peptidoglycan lytic exotransglycosylase n=1 Tax=Brevundimonas variabilis TaxID=74312 RepID=A0A7W9CFK5_9CAUL|nr:MltA domain-containing protein [Brevundimonas variabilis]MBB5744705.1 membrane-bound lytic murein transglycosylase A [Brevundimonas variabilis]
MAVVLAACAGGGGQRPAVDGLPAPVATLPVPPAPVVIAGDSPATLPGWDQEDHLAAFRAYVTGCGVARDAPARVQCSRARDLDRTSVTPSMARAFFETGFSLVAAETADGRPGLLTSYFAPEYPARRRAEGAFDTPVRPAPAGWQRGWTGPERASIEASAAPDAVAWMRAEDLFFMQIQGSAYLTFEDGTKARASYAADNGRPFVGIARPMEAQGLLPRNGTSGEAIRRWLVANRGERARAVTALNPRYIYFALAADDGGHPAGAAGVPLTARRGIAIDPASWTYGDLVWIQADGGNLPGARGSYSGLVMALDTGSAIRGPVRADLYMGRGDAAGEEAGSVRHPLRMWRLVPRG